jgi:hypothetical protein
MDVAVAEFNGQVLALVYTPRNGKIPVISFRPASRKERQRYMANPDKKASLMGDVAQDRDYWERAAKAVAKQDEEDEYIPFNPEDEFYDPNDDDAVEAFLDASEAFTDQLHAAGIRLDDYEAIERFKQLRG